MKLANFLLCMLGCIGAIATAQEPVKTEPAPTAEAAPLSIAQAIENTTFVTTNKPSTEAKFYMYLASASWCGPCRMVTPRLVREYPNMMANKEVEVILLSCDSTPEIARKYLEHYKAPFAAVMYGSEAAKALPGCPQDIHGIPHIVVVDANGKMVYRGHGLQFSNWKMQIEAYKTSQK